MLTQDLYEADVTTNNRLLIYLASQIVHLLWLEKNNPSVAAGIEAAAKSELLRRAGNLLRNLATHTAPPRKEISFGSLPSASELTTSTYLLDALKEADVDVKEEITDTKLGGEPYKVVETKLLRGELPNPEAQQKLIDLFSALRRLASHSDHRSLMQDLG